MLKAFPHLLDPTAFPDHARWSVRVPTWESFDHKTQLMTIRGFDVEDGRMVNWREDLDLHCETLGLGRVLWPGYQTIEAENLFPPKPPGNQNSYQLSVGEGGGEKKSVRV